MSLHTRITLGDIFGCRDREDVKNRQKGEMCKHVMCSVNIVALRRTKKGVPFEADFMYLFLP